MNLWKFQSKSEMMWSLFCLLNRPQGLPQFKYGRICALTKLWFSTVAIIELPYEPKRKNVHPPMMWLFTAHCSLMSWKPCCWSKTNKCLTTCPHFYNLFTILQLFHTSTLHLAQLLVTKTIGSETMGNSQLGTLNTDHSQTTSAWTQLYTRRAQHLIPVSEKLFGSCLLST